MKILRGYQKQTRAGDGKLKPQFPRPKTIWRNAMLGQGNFHF